jgi:hypothetical protein
MFALERDTNRVTEATISVSCISPSYRLDAVFSHGLLTERLIANKEIAPKVAGTNPRQNGAA